MRYLLFLTCLICLPDPAIAATAADLQGEWFIDSKTSWEETKAASAASKLSAEAVERLQDITLNQTKGFRIIMTGEHFTRISPANEKAAYPYTIIGITGDRIRIKQLPSNADEQPEDIEMVVLPDGLRLSNPSSPGFILILRKKPVL